MNIPSNVVHIDQRELRSKWSTNPIMSDGLETQIHNQRWSHHDSRIPQGWIFTQAQGARLFAGRQGAN